MALSSGSSTGTSTPTTTTSTSIPPPPSLSVPVWSLSCPISSSCGSATTTTTSASAQERKAITTTTTSDDITSMNIITFATPVSVAPPKLWSISLYSNTLTKHSFETSNIGILQLLTPKQSNLIPILGKHSGYELHYSKRNECHKLGYTWKTLSSDDTLGNIFNNNNNNIKFDILPNCASYIFLKLLDNTKMIRAGDHDVAICQVVGTGEWDTTNDKLRLIRQEDNTTPLSMDQHNVLYTGQLRQEGII